MRGISPRAEKLTDILADPPKGVITETAAGKRAGYSSQPAVSVALSNPKVQEALVRKRREKRLRGEGMLERSIRSLNKAIAKADEAIEEGDFTPHEWIALSVKIAEQTERVAKIVDALPAERRGEFDRKVKLDSFVKRAGQIMLALRASAKLGPGWALARATSLEDRCLVWLEELELMK